MTAFNSLSFAIVAAFALIHVFGARVSLRPLPRSVWLSLAGGVSVAYVFVHLLPELAAFQELPDAGPRNGAAPRLAGHVHLVALAGLVVFYGLERLARSSADREGPDRGGADGPERNAESGVFWLHIGSFALYNVLIGYLLRHREDTDTGGLILYGCAMALHFVINDHGLRAGHGRVYDRYGRWVLGAAPVLGWAAGLTVEVSGAWLAALFGFLAGGVVMNVLKEELPEERQSRFWAFALGAAAYTALLAATS